MPESTLSLTAQPPPLELPAAGRSARSRLGDPRTLGLGAVLLLGLAMPYLADPVWQRILLQSAIVAIAAIGLNLLVGQAGQLSVGQGALLAVGAYASVYLTTELDLPFIVSLVAGGILTAAVGTVIGLPSLRIQGLYLVMATLAGQLVIKWVILHWTAVTGGANGRIGVAPPSLFGYRFQSVIDQYYLVFVILVLTAALVAFMGRTAVGRAWALTRDAEHIAAAYGQAVGKNKLVAFTVSSFLVGVAGVLFAHTTGAVNPDFFGLDVSISYLIMIVIGGLGRVSGAILGAVVITALPEVLNLLTGGLDGQWLDFRPYLAQILSGLAVIAVLVLEPGGLTALIRNLGGRLGERGRRLLAARPDHRR
ncbi:branched-chain amino acid ABC transporter permease [Pseudonocardia sp. H11422]|uniref:branched-chain amino acid ABC transporter permease n=1 Tax=Pseudonocardia sp. H11422 TaxID=2835866 RepID=UPI001BDD8B53|nr:branched-chain amino acid ABC transporter permease [Pseudonocardia sp. H11422]